MKSLQKIALVTMAIVTFTSCTKESDVEYPVPGNILLAEKFDTPGTSPYTLLAPGWSSYAEKGTKKWLQKTFKGDGYATFSSFQSGEPVNITWLISPALNMDTQEGEKLNFQACQDGFVRSIDNTLELYVSTDYDGINFTNASWQPLNYKSPTPNSPRFVYENSGFIDLSKYKGTLYFAFKVRGTSSLTGGYQIDNVKVFY